MRSLLDVSVLIAMFDADHVFHDAAMDWWAKNAHDGWASCPLTENGVVRIMSNRQYRKDVRYSTTEIIESLVEFSSMNDHEFWPDSLSICDGSIFANTMLTSRNLTDIYLIGLAVEHGGKMASFDRNINLFAVPAASPHNLEVIYTSGESPGSE